MVVLSGILGAGLGLVREVGGAGFSMARAAGTVVEELIDEAIAAVREPGLADASTMPGAPTAPAGTAAARTAPQGHLASTMAGLLTSALEQSTAEAQEALFRRILDCLVPDEARIIGALSDGSRSPMVSVHHLTAAGMLGEAIIERAALVGRTANVALPRMTPTYVGHLLALGLLEVGPEEESLKDEYQILLAETDVLAAVRQGSRGPLPARVVRRTVRLTPLGHSLWAACAGDDR